MDSIKAMLSRSLFPRHGESWDGVWRRHP